MLKSLLTSDESTQTEFFHELELFSRCHHDNVVKLLGISRESLPVFAIYEYTDLVRSSFTTNSEKIVRRSHSRFVARCCAAPCVNATVEIH